MPKLIKPNGKIIEFDAEDWPKLSEYRWRISNRGYAVCKFKSKEIIMHRLIMNCKSGVFIDHKDGNRLNNRKFNLRFATSSQNAANTSARKHKKYTIYKGITWRSKTKKWTSSIKKNGKTIHIGNFSKELEAAIAYDEKSKELFGEFSRPNIQFKK